MSQPRILYFAIADGRGHLMRAQLLRGLLAQVGIDVDIATTSEEGAEFLHRFGVPARVLPDAFELQFDALHRLDEGATRKRLLATLSPARAARQLRLLEEWAEGAAFVVNDSMYPLLLLAAAWRSRTRVVQVVGENIHRSSWNRVHRERVPALRFAGQALLRRSFERSYARVFHSLGDASASGRTFMAPPLIAAPERAAHLVRGELGVGDRQPTHSVTNRLAAVYLNPHYRDPRIACAIERATAATGFTLYGVSEAFASRPGWRACDQRFADVANAADVLISGAGMAALEQSRVLGVPLVALLGRQPEQEANVQERSLAGILRADSGSLTEELVAVLSALPSRANTDAAAAHDIQQQWVSIFESLVHAVRTEEAHGEVSLAGIGNGEPQGRWSGTR